MKKFRKKIGILFSGGLDSAALIGFLLRRGFDVFPIYVRSGLRWESVEIQWARKFLRSARSARLHPLEFATLNLERAYQDNWSHTGSTPARNSDDHEVFLPGRNLLLTTKAVLALSSRNISDLALATLKGNPFPDAKPAYFRMLEQVYTAGFGKRIRIWTPFLRLGKADIIRRSAGFPLHLSLSCINPERGYHCGECNKCAERQRGYEVAGTKDTTRYVNAK